MNRREKFKASLARFGRAVAAVVRAVPEVFSFRDAMLFAGLGLVGYGLSLVWLPAAFLVPGGVLAAVAIFGVR